MIKHAIVVLIIVFLVGCVSTNTDRAAEVVKERKPQQCSFTDRFGETQRFEGPICENIARAKIMNSCSDLAEAQQGMCVMAVAFTQMNSNNSRTSDDVQLMIAGMNADARINSAWINQIPLVGTIASVHYSYKADKAMFDMLESGLTAPDVMNVTQSNDGGGTGGEAGGGGRGGDGDLLVLMGDNAQSINRSDGSVTSQGRNGNFMGLNEPDSSFDPTTANNNNATGATNENAPGVQNSDDDGGQSLIPNPF